MNKKGQSIIALRMEGMTCGEIQEILKLPKSTIAWWLKKAKLSKRLKKQILEKSRDKWRKSIIYYNTVTRSKIAEGIRNNIQEKALKEIKHLHGKELKLIGIALYWAEGSKSHRNHLAFANSDPNIIRIIMRFFREVCKIRDEKIKALIHLYPHIKEEEAINYWSGILNLRKDNFYKSQFQISKASRGRRSRNTLPFGTLHLTAGNTEIASMVKGWIEGVSKKL